MQGQAGTRGPVKVKGALMQTLHRLRRFRDLRAVSSGAWPPADGVPSPSHGATDQEARPAFLSRGFARSAAKRSTGAFPGSCLTPSWPSLARLGSRPAVPTALVGTGPESGAVPRGRQCQRAIRFRLSRERARLPDRVCRPVLVRQILAHPADGRAHSWQHDRPPVGVAACLPVCVVACLPRWPADSLPVYLSACLHVWQSACPCPSPDR